MGKSGKKTLLVVMLLLPLLLSACRQSTPQALNDPTLHRGAALFRVSCAQCHAVVRNDERVAPELFGVGERLTPDQLTQMIRTPASFYPGTVMPPDERFTAVERRALVRYLSSLRQSGDQAQGVGRVVLRCRELMKRARGLVSRCS